MFMLDINMMPDNVRTHARTSVDKVGVFLSSARGCDVVDFVDVAKYSLIHVVFDSHPVDLQKVDSTNERLSRSKTEKKNGSALVKKRGGETINLPFLYKVQLAFIHNAISFTCKYLLSSHLRRQEMLPE